MLLTSALPLSYLAIKLVETSFNQFIYLTRKADEFGTHSADESQRIARATFGSLHPPSQRAEPLWPPLASANYQ